MVSNFGSITIQFIQYITNKIENSSNDVIYYSPPASNEKISLQKPLVLIDPTIISDNQNSIKGLVLPANIKSNFTSSDGKPVLGLFVARDISTSKKVKVTQKIEDQLKK